MTRNTPIGPAPNLERPERERQRDSSVPPEQEPIPEPPTDAQPPVVAGEDEDDDE